MRVAHLALFLLAARDDPAMRSSVLGLSLSTSLSTGLLLGAAAADDLTQALLWATALVVDMGGPLLFGAAGWKLAPEHFCERHGLIVIIALGESVVAIGSGVPPSTDGGITAGVVLAAVVATTLVVALWWLYFDVVALVAARRLAQAAAGRERNEMARDSYSFLHLPMVAGIVLVALGLKKTLAAVGDPLAAVPAAALLGGTALYLIAHVAFRWRNVRTLSRQRLLTAAVLLALVPVATEVPALVAVGALTALVVGLVGYERVHLAPQRAALRAEVLSPVSAPRPSSGRG